MGFPNDFQIALVIVDMQNDFVLPGGPLKSPGYERIIPSILSVLALFREREWPVFHVVRQHLRDGSDVEKVRLKRFQESGGYAVQGTPGWEVVAPLTPFPHEYVVPKTRFSAFMNTNFDLMLRRLNISHLVVCGIQYPNCIRTTVFDAIAYGYDVTVLTDATAGQSRAIEEANILDMTQIGVQCMKIDEFKNHLSL